MKFNAWRKWLHRAFGLTRTAPIRRPTQLRLEGLEDRLTPSPNLQAGGVVHVPFTTTETEGSAGATVVTTNPQASPTLLDFTDPNGKTADYSVTITWGDGSSSTFPSTDANAPAVVTTTGGNSFHVVPTSTAADAHVYDEVASGANFTVQVTDVGSGASTGPVSAPFISVVSDAPLRVDTGPAFNATEGATASSVVLATFTDANPGDHSADFTTAITWGDGSALDTSSGAISYNSGTGVYTVTGSHTYAEEGSYFASVRIMDVGGFAVDTGVGLNGSGAVVTAAAQTPGAWYPDRFPPNGFVGGQTDFGRTGVIHQTISAADADGSRPPGFNTGFYDFQGRKYDLPAGSTYVTMDLYVPSSWAGLNQQDPSGNPTNYGSLASLWGTGVDITNSAVSFPIVGFNNLGTNNSQAGTAGFQVFDQTNGWTNVSGFTGYDKWYQLSFGVSGGNIVYFVNGSPVYTDTTVTGTTSISNEILQGYNGGNTYDIFWNPVQDTPTTVNDAAVSTPVVTPPPGAVEGTPTPANFNIAHFTDPAGVGVETTADFSATIVWGDGGTDTGTIVSDGSGNYHVEAPAHTYADEGSPTITVTVTHDALPPVMGAATAVVSEGDALSPAASQPTVAPTEGTSFSGAVAVFHDTGFPGNTAGDFTATIRWGDGTTDSGAAVTISDGGGGLFTVSGSHTYADEGAFTAAVTLTDVDDDGSGQATAAATATRTVAVAEGDALAPAGFGVTTGHVIEGLVFGGDAAVFSDSGYPGNTAADFTGTFDWGDGTTFSTANGTATVTKGSDGNYTLSVSGHAYADEGTYTVKATLSDDAPGTASLTQTGTLIADENDSLSGTGTPVSATEGASFTGQVAAFTSTYTDNVAADFTATIDWGDGTTTAGTVTGGSGAFTVSGAHTYADEGTPTITVTLTDDAPGTASATASATATVIEGDALGGTAAVVSTTEGQNFSGVVAIFSDTYTANTAADFSATINWGDGTTTAGTVTGGSGAFTVSGAHTYADEGTPTITVTLTDDAPGTASTTTSGTATVAEADVLTVNPIQPTLTATEGSAFSGRVANFSNTNAANAGTADFTTTIDWGDGTTTSGTLSNPGGTNIYVVDGTHTYADEGTFTVIVTFSDDAPGTASATVSTTATATEADVLSGTLAAISTPEGQAFSGTVATFTDTYTGNTASDFAATINWGDGTTTAGTVTGGSAAFTVSGAHTYADEGTPSITVTLTDDAPGTASATASGTATVIEADVLSGTFAAISTPEKQAFSGTVATFSDTYTGNTASDFTATINWGDGTTTAGTLSGGSGVFTVSGSHTYADDGSFAVTVTLTDDAPGTASATATGTASVAEVDAPVFTSAASTTFTAQSVGTFQLSASGSPAPSFSLSGAPSWLSINASNQLVGTPPEDTGNSTVTFTINATNGDLPDAHQAFTLIIKGVAPVFTSADSTTFTALVPGSFQLAASGAPAPTFSLSGAPAWLSVNSNNQLVGTPPADTGNSTISFTVTATNGVSPDAVQTFMLVVNEAPSIRGTVFLDGNSNGVLDSGEQGLSGRTVFLDLNHDATLDPNDPTAITDSSGNYTFSNLPSGTYTVRQQVSFDNFAQTGDVAKGLQVNLGVSAVTGVNFGNVLFAPAAPVIVNASIFGTSNPDANTAYIRGLYFALLGRDADRQLLQPDGTSISEVQYWLNQLSSGMTREQVALGVEASPEHRGLEVDSYYQSFLHRSERPDEQAFWVNVFETGADEATVVEGFLNSQEYQLAHASDTLFIQDLYVDILGRPGTSDELANVQAQIGMGATRAGLIDLFVHSDEENKLAVLGFYAAYLHRSSLTDPGSSDAVNRLNGGEALGAVQAHVFGDSFFHEFFDEGAATVSNTNSTLPVPTPV